MDDRQPPPLVIRPAPELLETLRRQTDAYVTLCWATFDEMTVSGKFTEATMADLGDALVAWVEAGV